MKKIRLITAFIIGISVMGLTTNTMAHDGHDDEEQSNASANIIEKDIEYSPEEQTVHVGQAIVIINNDPFEHKSRVTLQKKGGGLGHVALKDHTDKPGARYTFKLKKPGTYEIRCMLHDGMTATIVAIE